MKKRRFFAAVLALGMLATMTGCGDSEDSSSAESKTTTVDNAAMAAQVDEEANGNTAESSTAEPSSEAETAETSSPEYAYYDDLAAEWEKTSGRNVCELFNNKFAFKDNCVFFILCDKNNNGTYTYYLNKYNTETDKKDSYNIYIGTDMAKFFYANNSIYVFDNNSARVYDTYGNQMASADNIQQKPIYVSDFGYVICDSNNLYLGNYESAIIMTPDLKKTIDIPRINAKDAHGFDAEVTAEWTGILYNNRVYFNVTNNESNEKNVYYLDTDDISWHKTNLESIDMTDNVQFNFGKYLCGNNSKWSGKSGSYIYNLESDQYLTESIGYTSNNPKSRTKLKYAFCNTYFGGTHNLIDYQIGDYSAKWSVFSVRFSINGNSENSYDVDKEILIGNAIENGSVILVGQSTNYFILSDKYYVFWDNKGYFLREFTSGATGEKILCTFS